MAGRQSRPSKNTFPAMAMLRHGHPAFHAHGSPGLTPGDDGGVGVAARRRRIWRSLANPPISRAMISVLITAGDDGKALARLLSQLVPAVAEGLVREAAVIGGDAASRAVADDAGAALFAAGAFAEALEQARGPWIAGLPLTALFRPDWIGQLTSHLARGDEAPARLVVVSGFGFGVRPEGWLVPKRLAATSAVVVEHDLQRLARRGGRALRVLDRR
jgi:hypothetical protein